MTRRRLAAWLPPEERAHVLELRLHELRRAIAALTEQAEAIARDGATHDNGAELWRRIVRLEVIAHRPFRRHLSPVDRPAAGVRQLRTNL